MRAGLPEPEQGEPFLPGPVFAAPFHLSGDPYAAPASLHALRQPDLGALRGGASAGSRAPRRCCSRPGWRPPPRCCSRSCSRARSSRWTPAATTACARSRRRTSSRAGWRCGSPPPAELAEAARGRGPALARVALEPRARGLRHRGARRAAPTRVTVVDNTTAGPLLQRPLDLGADYSLTSATKQLSGHADLLLGYVTTRDPERAQALRDWRRYAGAIPGPFEAWLAHRSLPTLALRLERACDNASRSPGCSRRATTWPASAIRACRATRATRWRAARCAATGPSCRFDLGGAERAERFLAAAAARDRRDQLRRRPHLRRAARALGRRRRARRASSACPRAARTPPTCWRTSSARSTRDAPVRERTCPGAG